MVNPNHPFAFETNNKIIETKGLTNEYIKRTVNFNKPVTVEGIIASLTNKGDNKSFLDFMQHYITRPPEKLERDTIKKYAKRFRFRDALKFPFVVSGIRINFSIIFPSSDT